MTFEQSLQQLFRAAPDDYNALTAVRIQWKKMLVDDPDRIDDFYQLYFDTVEKLLARDRSAGVGSRLKSLFARKDGLTDYEAWLYIDNFSSSSWLRDSASAHQRRLPEHPRHLDLIRRAITIPDFQISEKHLPTQTGRWGDIPASMLSLYKWHLGSGPQADRLASEASVLVVPLFRAFPAQESSFVVDLLEDNPDGVSHLTDLVHFYAAERHEPLGGPMEGVSLNMLGPFARRGKFAHMHGAKILTGVLKDAGTWPKDAVSRFVNGFLLAPLEYNDLTQIEAAAEVETSIENTRKRLGKPYVSTLAGITPESAKARDEEYLEECREELQRIGEDFESWQREREANAVQRVATSATTRTILETAASLLPAEAAARISNLLAAALADKKPKKLPMPQGGAGQFKDFGLKLLVIEDLMYQQKLIEPAFDIYEFAREWEDREIDVEDDGYEIIPEVQEYFTNLLIAPELLARVNSLHQSTGLNGGLEAMNHLHPFWDPGSGDTAIAVTDAAIADLDLLPGLKKISGLESGEPSPKLLAALAQRGIELETEHVAAFGR